MPSFIASVGVSVTRGRLPGSSTLKGLSARIHHEVCMRWLMPIPVFPAMQAGTQPPDGVTETTQPSSSAASIDVVPREEAVRNVGSDRRIGLRARRLRGGHAVGHFWSRSAYGLVPPWNG